MPRVEIEVDPKKNFGMAIGSGFIAVEGCNDVATGANGKRRFVLHIGEADILWMIKSLAKELPDVLKDEACDQIRSLTTA